MAKPRDYDAEYEKYQSSETAKKHRAMRNKARRDAIKKHGKAALRGKDIDHKVPLSKGGSNDPSNRQIVDAGTNRGKDKHLWSRKKKKSG